MSVARVFIANRGEIAVRIIRACHALGAEAVVAVSEADRDSLAARLADRAVCIGPTRVRTATEAAAVADEIGFPVIVKAAAGGGGRGIKVVDDAAALGGVLEI